MKALRTIIASATTHSETELDAQKDWTYNKETTYERYKNIFMPHKDYLLWLAQFVRCHILYICLFYFQFKYNVFKFLKMVSTTEACSVYLQDE